MKQQIVLLATTAVIFTACTKTDITTPSNSLSSKTALDTHRVQYDSITFFKGKLTPNSTSIDSNIQLLMGDQFYVPKDCYIKTINLSVVRIQGICQNVWILLDGAYLQEIEHPVAKYIGDSVFAFAPNFPLKKGYHTVEFVGQTISTDKENMYFDILQGDATFIDITAAVLPISGLPISKERVYYANPISYATRIK